MDNQQHEDQETQQTGQGRRYSEGLSRVGLYNNASEILQSSVQSTIKILKQKKYDIKKGNCGVTVEELHRYMAHV